jgi:hypothetical protein
VYLLQPDRVHLVLSATTGLHPSSVGRVRMRLNDGLVGLVGEQLRPQVFADATTHPRFKYFPEAGEDRYHSFLGVPEESLTLFDEAIQTAASQLKALGDIEVFTEKQMDIGIGLDWPRK